MSIKKIFKVVVFSLFTASVASNLSGCAQAVMGAIAVGQANSAQAKKAANKKPELTQLQIRQLQTRSYETDDTNKLLQTALSVLQDDGFVVENADSDVGLLSASKSLKETHVDDTGTAFLKGALGLGGVTSEEFSTVQATVTVAPYGKETRVRLSVRLTSMEFGGFAGADTKYEAVTDPEYYQDFFAKLEKGIFIEQQGL